MTDLRALRTAVALAALLAATGAAPDTRSQEYDLVMKLTVPGNSGWVDTGIDVEEGEELLFVGEGQIVLQKGNPEAVCGPEGYDIHGIQQPLPDENLGCLAGKVSQLLGVRLDEKTEEEVREELIRYFFIGREQAVVMPLRGRLFVGINENVVKDNEGEFTVTILRVKIPADRRAERT